jgi:hypothetical protein
MQRPSGIPDGWSGLKPGRPAPKVLVVDDNDANREVLRQLLEGDEQERL